MYFMHHCLEPTLGTSTAFPCSPVRSQTDCELLVLHRPFGDRIFTSLTTTTFRPFGLDTETGLTVASPSASRILFILGPRGRMRSTLVGRAVLLALVASALGGRTSASAQHSDVDPNETSFLSHATSRDHITNPDMVSQAPFGQPPRPPECYTNPECPAKGVVFERPRREPARMLRAFPPRASAGPYSE
jgi:hypothetical protein